MEFVADYWPLWTAGMAVFYLITIVMHWQRFKSGKLVDTVLEGASTGLSVLEKQGTSALDQCITTMTIVGTKTMVKAYWPVLMVGLVGIGFSVMLGLSILFNILIYLKH